METSELVRVRFKEQRYLPGGQVALKGSVHAIPLRDLDDRFHELAAANEAVHAPVNLDSLPQGN